MEGGDNDEDPGKKQKKPPTPSSRIDHTYVDYSTRQLSELLPPQALEDTEDGLKRKGRITFPVKLHDIVSNPKYRQVHKVIALTFMSSLLLMTSNFVHSLILGISSAGCLMDGVGRYLIKIWWLRLYAMSVLATKTLTALIGQ
jgi:hypothetical protein